MAAKTTTFKDVISQCAEKSGKDRSQVGKELRGYIRRNFDTLTETWTGLGENGKLNRDGNRYPDVPNAVVKVLVKRYEPKTDEVIEEEIVEVEG